MLRRVKMQKAEGRKRCPAEALEGRKDERGKPFFIFTANQRITARNTRPSERKKREFV
jgi:hypothetical protein